MTGTIQGHAGALGNRNPVAIAGIAGLLIGACAPVVLHPFIYGHGAGPYDFLAAGIPFTLLTLWLVRICCAPPLWVYVGVAVVTATGALLATVLAGAVMAALLPGSGVSLASALGGMAGGLVSALVLAMGFCVLRLAPIRMKPWLPLIAASTLAGALMAVDGWLGLSRASVLEPVWQSVVAMGLVHAMRAD